MVAESGDPYAFTRTQPDAMRWSEDLRHSNPAEYTRLLREHKASLNGHGGPRLVTRSLASYEPEVVRWLWTNRLPRSKVSVMAGDGGEGKTFCTCGIAAHVTTGKPLPDCHEHVPRNVLIWNGEDGAGDTLRPRAEAAGADLNRIDIVEEVDEHGKARPFALTDLPVLEDRIAEDPQLMFVVIDPITALLGDVDSARDSEVRSRLQPFVDIARKYEVAILFVMHLRKGDAQTLLHRVSGSVAFGALPRSVMLVGTHALSGRKSIDTVKHNLAIAKPLPVEFALTEEGFVWKGVAPDLSAQSIIESKGRVHRAAMHESAETFLLDLLRNGPVDSKLVWAGAKDRGITDDALRKAKARLRVRATKHGFGQSGTWTWGFDQGREPWGEVVSFPGPREGYDDEYIAKASAPLKEDPAPEIGDPAWWENCPQ